MPPMDFHAAIHKVGLRVTKQRLAVIQAVRNRPHVSAAAVLADVSKSLHHVSHQAVYDCLAHLTEAGLLRRVRVDGGPMLYETRTGDNHHHFVCRTCNVVVDVDCATDVAPCLDALSGEGFVIDEAEITYRGFCADCSGGPAGSVAEEG